MYIGLKDLCFTELFVFLDNAKVEAGKCMCLLRLVHVYCAWYMYVRLELVLVTPRTKRRYSMEAH